MEENEKLLSLPRAAQFLGVSTASLRKWSDQGLVPVYRTGAGHRRYSFADLERFIESMREPPRTDLQAADMPRRLGRRDSAS